jgi:hypothetical protein
MSENKEPKVYQPKRAYTDVPAKGRALFKKAGDSKPQVRKMSPPRRRRVQSLESEV